VLVEVEVEADVRCPRCRELIPKLKRICDSLNIPLHVKYLSTRSIAAHTESVISKTFDPDWIRRHGLPEHKSKLSKIEPVLNLLRSMGAQATPNTIIRFHDGVRQREIVIRGYDSADKEKEQQFLANIYVLLKAIKGRVMDAQRRRVRV